MPTAMFRQGKVRDVYDLGDRLLMVASDRISAFDWVLPTLIPDKGRVLTRLSEFWFNSLGVPHHLLSTNVADVQLPDGLSRDWLAGRTMVVRKCRVVPVECVVRGYLSGSGWTDYQNSGQVCGVELPAGLVNSAKLPTPIFTPATKAEQGHDQNISFDDMVAITSRETAEELRQQSIDIYNRGVEHAEKCGIIVADTKFEWGWEGDRLILIDEVLTPDSSRFWPADEYQPGQSQPSFDKQFVRDYLLSTGWDRNSPPPELPDDIVERTRAKYIESYERITGQRFE